MVDRATTLEVLRDGDIDIVGRIVGSSNNALFVTVTRVCPEPEPATIIEAIHKPTAGERPLADFPDGTLTRREVAAWHVSECATGIDCPALPLSTPRERFPQCRPAGAWRG